MPAEDPALIRSGNERPFLVEAARARWRALGWALGAGSLALLAVLAGLVGLTVVGVIGPGLPGSLLLLPVVGVPLVLAALAWSRAKRSRSTLKEALEQAWQLVAAELLEQRGGELGAGELARLLRTDEKHAERLLALLSASGMVRSRVTDEANVVFSSYGTTAARLRVEAEEQAEPRAGGVAESEPQTILPREKTGGTDTRQ